MDRVPAIQGCHAAAETLPVSEILEPRTQRRAGENHGVICDASSRQFQQGAHEAVGVVHTPGKRREDDCQLGRN